MSGKLPVYVCIVIKLTIISANNTTVTPLSLLCQSPGYQMIEGKFVGENHWLCLKMVKIGSSTLSKSNTVLLLDPDAEGDLQGQRHIGHIALAHGYPLEEPAAGSAEGYLDDNKQFHGVLHFRGRTLYADPHGTDDPTVTWGTYSNDNIKGPQRSRRQIFEQDTVPINEGNQAPDDFVFNIVEPDAKPGIERARICELLLLADREYYVRDGDSSLDTVVRKMMHAVGQADLVFRNADFNEDGKPDNIGFSVKYILVLTSEETNARVFGKMLDHDVVDGKLYLTKLARLRRLSDVCLGAAFSGHAFLNGTLGLSFTSIGGSIGNTAGGICDRRIFGISYNVMAIAHAAPTCRLGTNNRTRVPERVAALTLAHELGHSFGSQHDNDFSNEECQGYLMGSHSSREISPQQYEFSPCSKKMMAKTISSMGYCLLAEDVPYCGNGIVETGEECDCGIPALCETRDQCCTPRGGSALVMKDPDYAGFDNQLFCGLERRSSAFHKDGCKVAPGAQCHPSQGMCCQPNCMEANLTEYGIHCENQSATCEVNNTEMVGSRCGLGGRCLMDGSCDGAECAKLGLRECQCPPYTMGSAASSAGRCGVCCLIGKEQNKVECVGAEVAARLVLASRERPVPKHWPDEHYRGPNVTVRLCDRAEGCPNVSLRAWEVGSFCVANNKVGICTPDLVCSINYTRPQSNVFPMRLTHSGISTQKNRNTIVSNILVIFINCYFK